VRRSDVLRQGSGRLVRLGLVAMASLLANFVLTLGLTEFAGLAPKWSFAIALAAVFTGNFFSTRHWVFRDRLREGEAWRQFRVCIAVSLAFRIGEWTAFLLLVERLGFDYRIAFCLVVPLSFLVKAGVYDRFVFR